MKQVIRKGFREIVVDDVPDPVVQPHHVLVRTIYSLISSGTETASIHQEAVIKEVAEKPSHLRTIWEVMKVAGPIRTLAEVRAKFSEYAALGYAGAGILIDKHETVRDLEIGDRVAYGGQGTGHAETIITGRRLVAKIPEEVPFEHACFTTLGSIALNAVRTANIELGDVVAVIGLGIVGQLVCQLVRLKGGVVVAVDLLQDRVDLAGRLGARHAVAGGANTGDRLRSITDGIGVDCAIVAAASKSSAPALQALEVCRDRGRIVVVGAVDLAFPYEEMYKKEIRLFMSRAYGPGSYDEAYEKRGQDYPLPYVRWTENRNMSEFLRLVGNGQVMLDPIISHRFALADASKAYDTIMDPATGSLAVLLRYPAAESARTAEGLEPKRRIEVTPAEKTAEELRVALVGAGNIARWAHLPSLKKARGATLHAVYSSSGVRGKSYARRFGASYCCSDYTEILNDPAIDIVLIASRHQDHFRQAREALEAGKHVFLEKPMCLTEDECRVICKTVEKTGKRLTVGFNRRFAPFYRAQKKELANRPGQVVINCRVNSPGISGAFWGADPAIGGAILGEAVHFIDLMYWLLEAEPVGVSAFTLPTGRKDPIGQNNLVASIRFSDGSIGNFTYCTVGAAASAGERVEVFMQGGAVATENFKRLSAKKRFSRTRTRWWPEKGYASQLDSFLTSIREGSPLEVTHRDGARATIVACRLLESARTLIPRSIDLDAVLR